jgi:xylulokinase
MTLAIDIGTTSAKAALIDDTGECLALERRALPNLAAESPIHHEIDSREWLDALSAILASLSRRPGIALSGIEAIVVSGNGPTLVPVDSMGQALCPAITWLDRRATEESEEIERILGRKLDPAFNLPKVLWLRKHRPEIFEAARWFSSCPEFVAASLCGEWVTYLPAWGYQDIIWGESDLRAFGLDSTRFPPFAKPGVIIGRTSGAFSLAAGLRPGIPVVSGSPDFIVALLGSAATLPGRACDRSGTSEGINLCWDGQIARNTRLLSMPHIIEPYRNISGVISTSGKAISWFSDLVGVERDPVEGFFSLVTKAKAGADRLIFLPYLAGERAPIWDPDARGAFIGLSLRHGASQMARAVAESTGFAMRDILDTMSGLGAEATDLRVTGRPAGNAAWNQIKADITGLEVLVPAFREAELMGDHCLAACALGRYSNPGEAAETLVRIERTFEPNLSNESLYKELFTLYRQSYAGLKSVYASLASIA